VLIAVLAMTATACSQGGESPPRAAGSTSVGTGSTLGTGSTRGTNGSVPVTVAAPAACNGDDEVNEDDDGARQALLQRPQLPALASGEWTVAETPPCPWALSADEVLADPACRSIASGAAAPANDERRNGNARVTFATPADVDVELDDRIEIYTSRQNVDAIRAILASPAMGTCYESAVRARATLEPGTIVSDVAVRPLAVQPDAGALALGFPAVAGYAADAGFAVGVDITFTKRTGGTSAPVALRVITFGAGGLMSTLTLIGTSPGQLDAIDLQATLAAAATRFRAMMGT
jgi:hypothetical protein